MRRTIAGWLIRAAHKIHPPKVTEVDIQIHNSAAHRDEEMRRRAEIQRGWYMMANQRR